jgi:hypothetical protein
LLNIDDHKSNIMNRFLELEKDLTLLRKKRKGKGKLSTSKAIRTIVRPRFSHEMAIFQDN